jgi:HAMP domain-containing protein
MSDLTIIIAVAISFSLILLRLLIPRRHGQKAGPELDLSLVSALPRHFRYFPQVRQALSAIDAKYLNERATPGVARKALQERRAVARHFLAGLREDFSNLERLARTVAAMSPAISREQETARLMLGMKFRILYAWVWLTLSAGRAPLEQIGQLTNLVGILATRMEEAMVAVSALSAPELNT